jgi:hypothetical protein
VGLGFKAFVTWVDGKVMDASFAGMMMIGEHFLSALSPCVDPCGGTASSTLSSPTGHPSSRR